MRYLLDTHVLIHSLISQPKLNQKALELLSDDSSVLVLSAITPWEVSIKVNLGKLELPHDISEFFVRARRLMSLQALDITHAHALAMGDLPRLHRDPFDRMLIAQARTEGLTLLTADRIFQRYDVPVIFCGR
jgi:PIN domain nuclease of toxin-antitoxin system